jgi:hypothetical protein
MASIARTNGVTINTIAVPENFNGKTPKFFAVVVKNLSGTAQDLSAEYGAEEAIDLINQLITNGSTSFNYGANILFAQNDSTGQISYCLEGSAGGWTAATLQTAVRALGTVNSIDCSLSTVTDVGMKLALS